MPILFNKKISVIINNKIKIKYIEMASYDYPLSANFPNGIDVGLLNTQIRNDTNIQEFLLSILVDEVNDTVSITFDSPLTISEKTALDNDMTSQLPVAEIDEFLIPNTNINLTTANLLLKVLVGTPTADITITLPQLSDITTTIPNLATGDSFDFSIINTSTTNNIIISSPVIGKSTITPQKSGLFRIKLIGTPTITSYKTYRLAA